ncbi:MAG: glycosyltransferase family 39 protein [Acetatifactor sp.]|nr:glycosyltransferase family 39 protein [Acetatifactor sp.]
MRQRLSTGIWRVFAASGATIIFLTVILCVAQTKDGIRAEQLMPPIFGSLVLFLLLVFILVKLEGILEKYQKIFLPLFLGCYALVVYVLCLRSRGIPVHDSLSVINGARYFAGLTDEMSWTYFASCPNNLMPAVYLSFLFRIAHFFGAEDGWYFAVAVNVVMLLAALYCVFRISGRVSWHKTASSWSGMLILAMYFPILGHTQSLYTDAFSFCFGVTAFYIWLRNQEKRVGGWRQQAGNVVAGIIWAVGMQLKMTVAISLIAVLLYLILFRRARDIISRCGIIFLIVAAVALGCRAYADSLPTQEYKDTWALPTASHFIAMGLIGDGGFDMYSDYFVTMTGTWGMEEKKRYIREFIWENKGNFLDPEHVHAKLRNNFAEGTMGASIFFHSAESHGLVYNCISYQGAHSWGYRVRIDGYWYMILILTSLCFLGELLSREKEREAGRVVAMLSIAGIMCYVMLSEANNRQLYNHLPWIMIAANVGLWRLVEYTGRCSVWLRERKKGKIQA